jgi:lipopolysaccharide transport system permease protein
MSGQKALTAAGPTRVTVIRPAPRLPHLDLPELWHFRELLATLVWRDVIVRYKQTFLGVAWAILVPLFTAAVYVVVFGKFADFPSGDIPYPSLVIAGVLPMQYFASALTGSSLSLASNLQLVTKVYFPRVLLPLAAVLVPMVDFLVGLPVLVALMAYYGTWPGGIELFAAPLFMGLAFVTALGIGFLLSAVNVRYRDVRYMIPVFLQVLPLL